MRNLHPFYNTDSLGNPLPGDEDHEPAGRTVSVEEPGEYGLLSTVVPFTGTDLDSGERVKFAVDHRPARHLLHALAHGEEPVVEVEDWQVLSVAAPVPAGLVDPDLTAYLATLAF